MRESQFAEVAPDGHLALPEETVRKLGLGPGMKFRLLADDEAILVMKLVAGPYSRTSVTQADLRLQQAALAKIWDTPAEDLYNDDV
ncbi:MAG: hypothetical protein FJ279_24820 [Planctomycetes bacterium]|nr:hypothetical protein [Planctomycetota bacterium]